MRFIRTVFLSALLPAASCMMLMQPAERTVPASPQRVVTAAADVFRQYGIPVARVDRGMGVVESESFSVADGWSGFALDQVVQCGTTPGRPEEPIGPVTLEIEANVDSDRPNPVERRQSVSAAAWSTVRIAGRGEVRRGDDEVACRLAREFADRMLGDIDRAVGGGADVIIGVRPQGPRATTVARGH